MPAKTPQPDEFGRLRVRDEDTGHEFSINAVALPHGNYAVLNAPASDAGGDALPVIHHESLSSPSISGQSAESKKENDNG